MTCPYLDLQPLPDLDQALWLLRKAGMCCTSASGIASRSWRRRRSGLRSALLLAMYGYNTTTRTLLLHTSECCLVATCAWGWNASDGDATATAGTGAPASSRR